MPAACPSAQCPCLACAGDRCRAERSAQGLPERIEDPAVYRQWGVFLAANTRSTPAQRAS